MSPLRDALDDYLAIRRSSGSSSSPTSGCWTASSPSSSATAPSRVTTELAVAGRGCRGRHARTAGASGSGWCAGSRGTWRRSTRDRDPVQGSAARARAAARAVHLLAGRDRRADGRGRRADAAAARRDVRTLIGLLAATGLRLGEALALDRADVDLDDGRAARATGSGASSARCRCTPDDRRGAARVRRLARPLLADSPHAPAFFLPALGVRLTARRFHNTFRELIAEVGLEGRGQRARPRPHDLRHSFAVRTLLDWHRAGVEVDRELPLLSTYLGHVDPAHTYWYLQAVPELLALVAPRLDGCFGGSMSALAPTLQAFFTERLITQREREPAHRSPPTATRSGCCWASPANRPASSPAGWTSHDLDAPLIGAFLDHLEQRRGNSPRTRNARLAAIHSLYRYAALRHPEHAHTIARVIEIPPKRHDRPLSATSTSVEIKALLARAGPHHLARSTRPRAAADRDPDRRCASPSSSALRNRDVSLGTGAHVRVTGKGRKAALRAAHPRNRRGPARTGCANARASLMTRCSRPDAATR